MAAVIAIAGATGFVGRALCRELSRDHRVIVLSRTPVEIPGVETRVCDLFVLGQVERALAGADIAIYLVHSMLPSARLTQAGFADLDLLLADDFARAAARSDVPHILYVGGLGGTALLAGIHDFRPALPWQVYQLTQARVHLAVMRGFGRHLARVAESAA
jgi:nucleoside-diphosphate-sugar epimerase